MPEYNFSFDNKIYLSFNSSPYGILDKFIEEQGLNKIFNFIPHSKIDSWQSSITMQLIQLIEKYEAPHGSFDPQFDKRNTILVLGRTLELSHTDPIHNDILLLFGLLQQIENCLIGKESFYIVSYNTISTQEQRTVLFMIKYLLRDKKSIQIDEVSSALMERFTEISNIRPNFNIPSASYINDNLTFVIEAMTKEGIIQVNQKGGIEKNTNLDKFVL